MVSDRAYRKGMDPAIALDRLLAGAGTQFDARVVAALERTLAADAPAKHAAHSWLRANGRIGQANT
jgi:HD-GYP domain-containing protein (c-di-GMP phosphodiesterase class II)